MWQTLWVRNPRVGTLVFGDLVNRLAAMMGSLANEHPRMVTATTGWGLVVVMGLVLLGVVG